MNPPSSYKKARARQWYLDNREAHLAKAKARYEANKEVYKVYRAAYYQANKARELENKRQWRLRKREEKING